MVGLKEASIQIGALVLALVDTYRRRSVVVQNREKEFELGGSTLAMSTAMVS